MNEEQEVSQRYRELGGEEPPRQVDEAILAASRRAADVRPAPLVPPTGRRRWYFPLAAAAVIMLSVAVTWHMQVEQPDPDGYAASPAREELAGKDARAVEGQIAQQKPDAQPEFKRERQAAAARGFTPDPAPAARDQARAMEQPARESAPVAGARAPEAARADALLRKPLAEEPPEKWLERIAELRRAGKHDEADKALEEFRKRYPDYKLPESVLRR